MELTETAVDGLFEHFARGDGCASAVDVEDHEFAGVGGWGGEDGYLVEEDLGCLREMVAVDCGMG